MKFEFDVPTRVHKMYMDLGTQVTKCYSSFEFFQSFQNIKISLNMDCTKNRQWVRFEPRATVCQFPLWPCIIQSRVRGPAAGAIPGGFAVSARWQEPTPLYKYKANVLIRWLMTHVHFKIKKKNTDAGCHP